MKTLEGSAIHAVFDGISCYFSLAPFSSLLLPTPPPKEGCPATVFEISTR